MKKIPVILLIMQTGSAFAGIVADTLFCECRGEPASGRMAVASVIWNRSKNKGISQEAVCLARKQFSCWNKGYYAPKVKSDSERAIMAEFEAIERDMKAGTFTPSVLGRFLCPVLYCSQRITRLNVL